MVLTTPDAGVGHLPRIPLGCLPTPLHEASRLSEVLGLPVWFKRDDLVGVGLGGSKVRALEFILGDGVARGCDALVTGSGPQSNWSMLAALTGRRCGLDATLCFYGDRPAVSTANLALVEEFTRATLRFTGDPDRSSVDALIDAVAAELVRGGRRPLTLPRGGATPLGSIGCYLGALEIAEQAAGHGLAGYSVWLPTGSCGLHAGMVVGASVGALGRVVGVSVSRPVQECRARICQLAAGAAALVGLPAPDEEAIEVLGGWIGPGYGVSSEQSREAADLVARTEGVLLDPYFGAKAMAALVDAARGQGERHPVVFVVSGGAPTLFARNAAL